MTNKNNVEDDCFAQLVAALPGAACLFERVSDDERVQWL